MVVIAILKETIGKYEIVENINTKIIIEIMVLEDIIKLQQKSKAIYVLS